jgi:hypothetical protein
MSTCEAADVQHTCTTVQLQRTVAHAHRLQQIKFRYLYHVIYHVIYQDVKVSGIYHDVIYNVIYHVIHKYGIYHGIYHYGIYYCHCICELTILTFRFPCQAGLVRPAVPCVEPTTTLPSPSQSSKLSLPSPSLAEWNSDNERYWDDYNYVPPAHSDPLAGLLDVLPGLDTDAIAAMIHNLPMPNVVEVPGL